MSENMIQINQVTKTYQHQAVVENVSMNIKAGEIYGFLGPNGAGKTTLMKMMLNLVKPTQGDIRIFNEPIIAGSYDYLKNIGNIIEVPTFYDKMTAYKNLWLHCQYLGFYDEKRIEEALALLGLTSARDKKVQEFSLGMKQRLAIARAIITRPKLLILDEPINGLDPIGIKEMRILLERLRDEYGTTILISSHIIAEIELLADRIGVINNGRLIKEVEMSEVHKENVNYLSLVVGDVEKAAYVLTEKLNLNHFKIIDEQTIRIYDMDVSQGSINQTLILNQVMVEKITEQKQSLEEYFLHLIQGGTK